MDRLLFIVCDSFVIPSLVFFLPSFPILIFDCEHVLLRLYDIRIYFSKSNAFNFFSLFFSFFYLFSFSFCFIISVSFFCISFKSFHFIVSLIDSALLYIVWSNLWYSCIVYRRWYDYWDEDLFHRISFVYAC